MTPPDEVFSNSLPAEARLVLCFLWADAEADPCADPVSYLREDEIAEALGMPEVLVCHSMRQAVRAGFVEVGVEESSPGRLFARARWVLHRVADDA